MKNKIVLIVSVILFVVILIFATKLTNQAPILNENKESAEDVLGNDGTSDNQIDNAENSKVNKIVYADENNFEKEVLKSEMPVIIDFYADWCTPCQWLSPIIEEIANENDNIKVVKVNVDECPNLAVEYNAISIPTIVLIKEGKETNRLVGYMPKETILREFEI